MNRKGIILAGGAGTRLYPATQVICIEEIAWRMGFIDNAQLGRLAHALRKSTYGEYLAHLLSD